MDNRQLSKVIEVDMKTHRTKDIVFRTSESMAGERKRIMYLAHQVGHIDCVPKFTFMCTHLDLQLNDTSLYAPVVS